MVTLKGIRFSLFDRQPLDDRMREIAREEIRADNARATKHVAALLRGIPATTRRSEGPVSGAL